MFITGLIAGVVPYFGDVMDLLGSLTQCLLVFVMPIVFFHKLGGLDRAGWCTKVWACFVLVIGMIALVLGTIDAVKHLVADFRRK
jgi:amino acid permease